jgi:hypothetical protein
MKYTYFTAYHQQGNIFIVIQLEMVQVVVFLLYYRMYSTFVYILQPRAAVKYHCLLTNQPTTGIDC